MYPSYIAIKHQSQGFGEWCVTPKDYFDKWGRIPDSHSNLDITGMDEVSDHTYKAIDGTDGVANLLAVGIVVEENPSWYWMRYPKIEDTCCMSLYDLYFSSPISTDLSVALRIDLT